MFPALGCDWLPLKAKLDPNELPPLAPLPNMLPDWELGVLAPEPAPKLMAGAALPAPKEKGVADDWLALVSVLPPKLNDEGVELAPLANGLLNDVCSPPPTPNVNEELVLPPNTGAVDCVLSCCWPPKDALGAVVWDCPNEGAATVL